MHSLTRFDRVEVPADAIARITALYDRGLYLQAYDEAKKFGDLRSWNGTAARVIGGRLAGNLGSRKIANWLYFRAWRDDRTHAEASYFCGLTVLERRGPLAAWKFVKRLSAQGEGELSRSDLHTLRGRILGHFRDFERAEAELAEAEKVGGNLPWVWCERASIFEMEDRYPAALEASQQALTLRPWFRPAVQQAAHLLQLLGRDDEAVALLQEALTHIESGACAGQLSAVLEELGRQDEAVAAWQRARELHPLYSEEDLEAWHGRAADLLYLANRRAKAAENARLAKSSEFHLRFAERLEDASQREAKRVQLPVGFVRQHHVTCAPATLAAVAGFLGQPVDHLALAGEITYDGTPDHVERAWAERSGFITREFRVTWETAVALVDRGIPFTLTTTEITSGHLQAVIGYDALRQTLIIRDPYQRYQGEFQIEPLLKRYAAFGPRGMVLVPASEAHRLDGIELPDAAFFDAWYQLRRATHAHDRAAAEAALRELEDLDPNHRLTLFGRRELAFYDGSLPQQLATTEALLKLYPDAGSFLFAKSRLLSELAHRTEYEDFLKELASRDVDPLFWREWAQRLASKAQSRGEAYRLLLRVLRFQPLDAENLASLANLLWDERDFARATELYRLAACLRDTIDSYSRSYFLAARHLRDTEVALQWLRERCERHGKKSSQPARILFWALQILDRSGEAFTVLETVLTERPEDGGLLLHAADAFARQGDAMRADMLLEAAESRSSRSAWLRTAANIADYRGDLPQALKLWREILDAEPLAADAQRTTMRLIAEVDGRAAALKMIEELAERFPHYIPLHRLWVEWVRFESNEEWQRIVRRSLALDPNDAWLRRELALALADRRHYDEALAEADEAVRIEPQSAISHSIRGDVLLQAGQLNEAREALRHALTLSVDTPSAINSLITASHTLEEKRREADFIRGELVRQVVFGDGLLAFREYFFTILEPEELLAALKEAHAARPDLWHAWSALIRQLVDMRRLDEALARASEAAGRFPSVPAAWTDLALVNRLKQNRSEEIRALRRALILSPSWGTAARDLANAHESRAEFDEARRALESAIANAPLDATNHGALADLLWRRGERADAVERVITAVRRDPGYNDGWNSLREWTSEIGQPERAVEIARELTVKRPGEARSWFFLGQILPKEKRDEALVAIDRAIELSPRFVDAHDLRAFLLVQAGRLDDAVAACAPAQFGNAIPPTLLIRAAWIEAVRGHTSLAIEKARAAVAAHPSFYWGWSEIAEWTFKLERYRESLEASEKLARLAPRATAPLGFVARAQYALGQKLDAYASLKRAFDLDPTYEFAGYTLFDHYLEARELSDAARILAQLQTHLPGPNTDAAKVRLAARKGDGEAALEGLRALLFCPVEAGHCLREAVDTCVKPCLPSRVDRLLYEALDQPGVNPEVGAIWVDRMAAAGEWGRLMKVYGLDPESEIGRRARFAYVGELGARQQGRCLNKLLARERKTLSSDTRVWGHIGYAFAALGRWREAVSWLSDWQQRKDLRPWMLTNLSLALRHEGQHADAEKVSQHALSLTGDHTTSLHHTWAALDSAVAGRVSEAQMHLAHSAAPEGGNVRDGAHALAGAIVAVETAAPERRAAEYSAQKNVLRNPTLRSAFRSPILRGTGKRAVEVMARAAGQRPFRLVPVVDFWTRPRAIGKQGGHPPAWMLWVVVVLVANLARFAAPTTTVNSTPAPRWSFTPRPFSTTPDFRGVATPFPLQHERGIILQTPDPRSTPRGKSSSTSLLPDVKFEPIPTPRPPKD